MSNTFTASVRNFTPARHGFLFKNSFEIKDLTLPDSITRRIALSKYGLCGGMAHGAHELFEAGEAIPRVTTPPKPKTPLYFYLTGGLLESFGPALRDMNKMISWYEMPDGSTALPKLTIRELQRLKIQLLKGKLTQLMICYNTEKTGDAWDNHQVLAYRIEERDKAGTIWIYEPNNSGNENARIEYTLDDAGVHMNEFEYQTDVTGSKQVHGFFCVFPRVEDPLTKPAYLLHKGTDFFMERMKNNLRMGIYDIARDLTTYSQLTPLQIVQLLRRFGYSATDIARVCKDVFKLSVTASLNLLTKLNFTAGQLTAALHIVFRKTASWIVTELLKRRLDLIQVATAVQAYFRMQLVDLVKVLKAAGVTVHRIVSLLRNKFGITNVRTLARMLREARFTVSDIIGALKRAGMGIKDAIIILRSDFRSSVLNAAKILRDHFGNKPADILKALWKYGNTSFGDLLSAATRIFGMGRLNLLRIL